MVVLQLFNREKRSFDKFSEVNAVHMEAFKDAIMAHAVYYPVVEILSSTAIACVIWFGGNDIIRGLTVSSVAVNVSPPAPSFLPRSSYGGEHRGSHRVHPVRAALLPAHSGFQREVQHSAVGHGGQRTRFQAAGYAGGDHFARGDENADSGPGGSSSIMFGLLTATRRLRLARTRASRPRHTAMLGLVGACGDGSPTRPGRARLGYDFDRTRLDSPRRFLHHRTR